MGLTIVKGGTPLPERSVSPLVIVVGGPEPTIVPKDDFGQLVRDFLEGRADDPSKPDTYPY